jgi:glucose-1-phosphate thymidylyltransferase
MAGYGTRLRPQTWSRPKQLVSLAGKTVLAHVLDTFSTLPDSFDVEYIFIVGYLGEKVEAYMREQYPQFNVNYVVQDEMLGQSHAIHLAREHLQGPMLMVFADTLIQTELSFLADEEADAVAWVKPVPDPRRFGIAKVGEGDWVTRLIEKPKEMHDNLAVVGFYYFKRSEDLISAIEEQMDRDVQLKGEYFLADAVNIMLERGLKMRTQNVDIWLDAGTPEAVMETNRYLLGHGRDNSQQAAQRPGITVIPPVFIHPSAKVETSILGPYVSIGADCSVTFCVLKNSILEDGSQLSDVILEKSLIGQNAQLKGCANSMIVGDDSTVQL